MTKPTYDQELFIDQLLNATHDLRTAVQSLQRTAAPSSLVNHAWIKTHINAAAMDSALCTVKQRYAALFDEYRSIIPQIEALLLEAQKNDASR